MQRRHHLLHVRHVLAPGSSRPRTRAAAACGDIRRITAKMTAAPAGPALLGLGEGLVVDAAEPLEQRPRAGLLRHRERLQREVVRGGLLPRHREVVAGVVRDLVVAHAYRRSIPADAGGESCRACRPRRSTLRGLPPSPCAVPGSTAPSCGITAAPLEVSAECSSRARPRRRPLRQCRPFRQPSAQPRACARHPMRASWPPKTLCGRASKRICACPRARGWRRAVVEGREVEGVVRARRGRARCRRIGPRARRRARAYLPRRGARRDR